MIPALIVSIVILIIMFILIPAYLIALHKRTETREEILRVVLYSMSFTQLACFVTFNENLILDLADIAMFFVSPIVFFSIGWLLCIYIHSFFTLLFITLNLSAFIVSVINKSHISFPIVSFLLLFLHIIQLLYELKVNHDLLKKRKDDFFLIILGPLSLLVMFFNFPLSSEKSLVVKILFPVIAFLLVVMFIVFATLNNIWMTILVIVTGAYTMIIFTRIINIYEALVIWFLILLGMWLSDFFYMREITKKFQYNGNKYQKVGFHKVCLIRQYYLSNEIIGEVYNDDTKYKVTSYSNDCLGYNLFEELIFLPKSHIINFKIANYNNKIKKVILEINEKPNFYDLLSSLPELNEIVLKCENKFLTLESGIIYNNSDLSICFANKYIKRLAIREHVQAIGSLSFQNCSTLSVIHFPDSLITIGEKAFMNCNRLKSISFPANLRIIEANAFYYCSQLEKISFSRCKKLETIQKYAFSETSIKRVALPICLKEINLTAFESCKLLLNVIFQEGSKNVRLLNEENYYGYRIVTKTLRIPHSCGTISSDFFKVTNGYKVEFPDFRKWNLKRIEERSFKDSYYKEFSIPPSVEYIGKEAFAGSTLLRKIEFPDGSKLSYCHPTAFSGCPMLRSFVFSDENVIIALNFKRYNIFWTPPPQKNNHI